MNKIIIALGLSLAATTAAFANSSVLDIYVPQQIRSAGVDYTATASVGGAAQDQIVYNRADNDGSPVFLAPQGSVDYTATASIGGVANDHIIYHRADNDGSPTFLK